MALAQLADPPPSSASPLAAPEGLTPPASLSAEQAILGGIMLNESSLDNLEVRLQPEDFYDNKHKLLYAAIAHLQNKGGNIDMVTCAAYLEANGQLQQAGTIAYLAELTQNIGTIANVPAYARIVKNCSVLRKLIQAGGGIMQNCYQSQNRAYEEVIDEAERLIYSIGQEESALSAPRHVSLGTTKALQHMMELGRLGSDITGIQTGYDHLDQLTSGLNSGDLIIVAARPGCGKTAFALNLVQNIVESERNSGVLFFSLEMSAEPIVIRMLANKASLDHSKLRTGKLGPEGSEDWLKVTNAIETLDAAPFYIDEAQGLTVTEIRSRMRRVDRELRNKYQLPLRVVFVDYLQLIQSNKRRQQESRASEIGEISRTLKELAKEFNVTVVAMSQLNRLIESRQDKTPMLSDLRESGSIEQDADIIIFLHDPNSAKRKKPSGGDQDSGEEHEQEQENANSGKPHQIDLLIRKNRNGRVGKVATTFIPHFLRFKVLTDRVDQSDLEYNAQFSAE